jgi:hypothetical protein
MKASLRQRNNAMSSRAGTTDLFWLALFYAAASLLHFTHNAEFLGEYPNLPAWLSRSDVYLTWLASAALGAFGCVLLRYGREGFGLAVLALYACSGFDGLLHYGRAPFAAHSTAMNFTILLEAFAGALLLIAVLRQVARTLRRTV